MPQFDSTYFVSQVFWLFLCLGVLASVVLYSAVPRIQKGLNRRAQYLQDIRDREELYLNQIADITQKMSSMQMDAKIKSQNLLDEAHARMAADKEKTLKELSDQFQRAHEANLANLKRDVLSIQKQMPDMAQELSRMLLAQLLSNKAQ